MIELPKQKRDDAVASLRRYFEESMETRLGELPAGLLLNFVLEEIGPAIYNQGVSDSATRMQLRAADLEGELYVDEFQYWSRRKQKRG